MSQGLWAQVLADGPHCRTDANAQIAPLAAPKVKLYLGNGADQKLAALRIPAPQNSTHNDAASQSAAHYEGEGACISGYNQLDNRRRTYPDSDRTSQYIAKTSMKFS
jgi:hypothetical protein